MYTLLKEFGMSKSKADVYLACLNFGSSSTEQIARKIGIPRTTVHEILQSLCSLGIISYTTHGRTRIYTAEDPKKFEKILKNKEQLLQESLPELLSLFNPTGIRPQVRIYDGIDGIKTVFDDLLTVKTKKLFGILSMKDLFQTVGKSFMNSHIQKRISENIELRVIRSEEKEVEDTWHSSKAELRTVHYAPEGMIFPMTQYFYDNKVAVMSTKREGFGMIIESSDFYTTQKNFFDVLWQVTRVLKKVD